MENSGLGVKNWMVRAGRLGLVSMFSLPDNDQTSRLD